VPGPDGWVYIYGNTADCEDDGHFYCPGGVMTYARWGCGG